MAKKSPAKNPIKERKVDPESFYTKTEGICNQPPEEKKFNLSTKRKEAPVHEEKVITHEEPIPQPFDSEDYKKKENKTLEKKGSDVRVYNKSSVNMLIVVLIGVIIVFGLFFVWSVSNDKFKTDFTCPDCTCEQPELSCPEVIIPDCNCNQNFTCVSANNSDIINAINNLNVSSVIPVNSSS